MISIYLSWKCYIFFDIVHVSRYIYLLKVSITHAYYLFHVDVSNVLECRLKLVLIPTDEMECEIRPYDKISRRRQRYSMYRLITIYYVAYINEATSRLITVKQ